MARHTRFIARVTLLAALLGVVPGGCGATYRVDVRNESGRTAIASVVRGGGLQGERTLETRAIPGGETAELGPYEAPGVEGVRISVTRPGDLGSVPSRTRLQRGYNAFVIEAGGVERWEAVVLRRVE